MQAIAIHILKSLQNSYSKLRGSIISQARLPKTLLGAFVAIALLGCLGACSSNSAELSSPPKTNLSAVKLTQSAKITISEVSPPATIQKLSRYFDTFEPQIKIIEPKPDQILADTKVSVQFEVKDLPIFKNPELGLGTHVHVILDNQEYKASYDLNKPLVFENLSVGTHTIRAFASRPWHESFKNEGAFAQTTFHVYTKTAENTPNPQLPLLTYSRPVGTYGAEPIMLDFYLKNTPLHAALLEESPGSDWQIRVTVNNQSFIVDQWLPVYIKGLNTGLNWVKLEFLDAQGHLVPNQFNSTAHLINYQPGGTDTLSRLVRGEAIAGIEGIVNPNYIAESKIPEDKISDDKASKNTSPKVKLPEVKELKSEPKPEKVKEIAPNINTKIKSVQPPESIAPTISNDSEPLKVATPEVVPTPKSANPLIKLPILEPTSKEVFKPVETVNQPANTPDLPIIYPKTPEVFEKPKSSVSNASEPRIDLISEPSPQVLKGLDNLNLKERLKQSRQKKATEDVNEFSNAQKSE